MTDRQHPFSSFSKLALAAWLGAGGVHAASNGRPVDIPERIRGAGKVVVATALAVVPEWRRTAHGDQVIVSRVRLKVEETLKGDADSEVWVEIEGGTLGGFMLRVSSQAELRAGDRAVFLLDRTESATYVPHLKGQGVLELDPKNFVKNSSLHLDDIRRAARAGR